MHLRSALAGSGHGLRTLSTLLVRNDGLGRGRWRRGLHWARVVADRCGRAPGGGAWSEAVGRARYGTAKIQISAQLGTCHPLPPAGQAACSCMQHFVATATSQARTARGQSDAKSFSRCFSLRAAPAPGTYAAVLLAPHPILEGKHSQKRASTRLPGGESRTSQQRKSENRKCGGPCRLQTSLHAAYSTTQIMNDNPGQFPCRTRKSNLAHIKTSRAGNAPHW